MFLKDEDIDDDKEKLRVSVGLEVKGVYIPPRCSRCGKELYVADDTKTTQCFECGKISNIKRSEGSLNKRSWK